MDLSSVRAWFTAGLSFAMARIVCVQGSAPLPLGSIMFIGSNGSVYGSVSGGCVEGEVVTVAHTVIATGEFVREGFGVDDEFITGMTCGGYIEVLVERVSQEDFPDFGKVLDALEQGSSLVWSTVITDGHGERFFDERPDDCGDYVFVHRLCDSDKLIIFGVNEYAVALCDIASAVGYEVTVVEAREAFAQPDRFPRAHQVVRLWPEEFYQQFPIKPFTAICVLTHDVKFDVPALVGAFDSAAGYIGAMGSRRTVADRRERLIAAGVSARQLERLYSPIGLDLGGKTAAETAISIVAEIIAARSGARCLPLSSLTTPIHDRSSLLS